MSRRLETLVGVVLSAMLVALLVATVYFDHQRYDGGDSDSPESGTLVAPAAAGNGFAALSTIVPSGSHVLMLGDSYTEGYGASRPARGWSHIAASQLGWDATFAGVGGTGYTTTKPTDFLSRLNKIVRSGAKFDAVVLQGSQNDGAAATDVLQTAMARVIDAARAAWPDAVLISLAPSPPEPLATTIAPLTNRIASIASALGIYAINPQFENWMTPQNSIGISFDSGHPNDRGYAIIARAFVRDMQAKRSLLSSYSA